MRRKAKPPAPRSLPQAAAKPEAATACSSESAAKAKANGSLPKVSLAQGAPRISRHRGLQGTPREAQRAQGVQKGGEKL
eukprot:9493846-Pyramimonas_sp.AAC.1